MAYLAMRIMVQFIGQAVGVTLLRKRNGTRDLPYKMPLYPLPVILAIVMWLFVFYATGLTIIVSFFVVLGSGVIMYFILAKMQKQWPFGNRRDKDTGRRDSIVWKINLVPYYRILLVMIYLPVNRYFRTALVSSIFNLNVFMVFFL